MDLDLAKNKHIWKYLSFDKRGPREHSRKNNEKKNSPLLIRVGLGKLELFLAICINCTSIIDLTQDLSYQKTDIRSDIQFYLYI